MAQIKYRVAPHFPMSHFERATGFASAEEWRGAQELRIAIGSIGESSPELGIAPRLLLTPGNGKRRQ